MLETQRGCPLAGETTTELARLALINQGISEEEASLMMHDADIEVSGRYPSGIIEDVK